MSFTFWPKGSTVTDAALKKQFGPEYRSVLGSRLELQPKTSRRERNRYKIVGDMPKTPTEYSKLRTERFTVSVDSLIEDAYSEIDSLADEMREAFDNTPESLQESDVGNRRGEAADNLENIRDSRPDTPEACGEITCIYIPSSDQSSRPKRASAAADMLTTAANEIRDYIDNLEDPEESEDGEESDAPEVDKDELSSFADELEEAAGELESVDFPSMYG